mmetsp:Transcript_129785/g.323456  ORF Transcript_129785/g.323456 Transcript_129785/m.323456 type:complete len:269 (-) Transcript_129785:1759-2565(-)
MRSVASLFCSSKESPRTSPSRCRKTRPCSSNDLRCRAISAKSSSRLSREAKRFARLSCASLNSASLVAVIARAALKAAANLRCCMLPSSQACVTASSLEAFHCFSDSSRRWACSSSLLCSSCRCSSELFATCANLASCSWRPASNLLSKLSRWASKAAEDSTSRRSRSSTQSRCSAASLPSRAATSARRRPCSSVTTCCMSRFACAISACSACSASRCASAAEVSSEASSWRRAASRTSASVRNCSSAARASSNSATRCVSSSVWAAS